MALLLPGGLAVKMTEDREQRTDDRGQRIDDRWQTVERVLIDSSLQLRSG